MLQPGQQVAGRQFVRRELLTRLGRVAAGAAALGSAACLGGDRIKARDGGRRMNTVESTSEAGGAATRADTYVPPRSGEAWETVAPAAAGWDDAALTETAAWAAEHNTVGLMLLHRGRVMLERYANDGGLHATRDIASAQKSVTSLLVGIAQEQGLLAIEDVASAHVGQGWSGMPAGKEELVTVRHLITMSSGTDEEWRYLADAGTAWYYNNPAYHLAKRVVERAARTDLHAYTEANLGTRIGLQDTAWRVRPLMRMPDGVPMTGLFMSTRDMARFGLLVLNDGAWDGRPVLRDTAYLRASTDTSQTLNLSYGYLWWLNGKATHRLPGPNPTVRKGPLVPAAPPDMFAAMGANDNRVYVVPSLDLVVARQGRSAFEASAARSPFDNELWTRVMKAAPR